MSGPGFQHQIAGPVADLYPGSETCNATVLQATERGVLPHTVTITTKEFEIVFTGHGRMIEHGPYKGFRSEGEFRRALEASRGALHDVSPHPTSPAPA